MKMNISRIDLTNRLNRFTILMVVLLVLLTSAKCANDDGQIILQDDPVDMNDPGDNSDGETQEDPFTIVTRITPNGIQDGDFFGYTLAATSEFTAASAPFDSEKGTRTGAVYIFKRNGSVFEATSHIIYPASATMEDYFGWSLDLDGETLVIGAPKNDKNGEDAGSVYVYQHSGNNQWSLVKELEVPNAAAGQEFGTTVALDNGVLVVGSKFDAENYYDEGDITNAGGIAQGSVYLFEEFGGWNFTQKLVPTDEKGHLWDAFGQGLDIKENTIAIGAAGTNNTTYKAPGSVYVFEKFNETWEQTARIEATDGRTEDFFGSDLSLDGNHLAIASPGSHNSLMPNQNQAPGAAYIFTNSGNEWSQEAKLLPADVLPSDNYGSGGIGLHKDYVAVGAPFSEEVTKSNGSVHFFKREAGWPESHKIIAPDPLNEDVFGGSIAVTEDLIFVGAHRRCNETGCWAGALYFVE